MSIKTQTEGWPESVWILGEKDFTRGAYEKDDGRCCLVGRVHRDFGVHKRHDVFLALIRSIKRRGYKIKSSYYQGSDDILIKWNDDTYHTLRETASVWNETMRRELGYTEITDSGE